MVDESHFREADAAAHSDYPLELSGVAFWRLVEQAVARLSTFLDTLPDQQTSAISIPDASLRTLMEPLPTEGTAYERLLQELFDHVFPMALNTTGPGYLGYIPGGGLPHSAIADLVSMVTNRYVGLAAAAPLVAQIEATVIRWFCEIVEYPEMAGGFLTSGGSLANWAALVVARQTRMADNFLSGTIYTSSQAHHSVTKAALLAGIPRDNVREIEVDRKFRVRLKSLQRRLSQDRRKGLTPLAIVAHAGTTNTGAVDDLEEAANLAAEENVWLHVDAAYGGFFMLTERGRTALKGLQRANSITLDPHKGLFLPYGTGCLLVSDRELLRRTFALRGEYMTAEAAGHGAVDFCDISPELSRDFRGLRIWLPLKMHGVEPFQRCLDEKLDLIRFAATQLKRMDNIELVADPQLSTLAFRFVRRGASEEELAQLNRTLLDHINAGGRVFLTPTILDGRFVIRLCILSFRTHQDRIAECIEIIRYAVKSLA